MHLMIRGKSSRRLLTPQMVKVMKLTFFLLTAAFLHVSARGFSQTITFSGKDVPLQTVFDAVTKQTGYTVFCNYEILRNAKKVTLDLKNASIETAMQESLKEQSLTYSIVEKTIVVKPNPTPVLKSGDISQTTNPLPLKISGTIRDEDGQPLVGANITIIGSNKTVTTNDKGYFEIDADPGQTLIVSYVGFESKEIKVMSGNAVSVSLKRSDNPLDQIQVIAYGTTSKRLGTGNINTVKAADIEKQPVSNPLLALEGRVPGVFITQATGIAGSGVTVRIQGQNSIIAGNDPLYVIDGVPYPSQMLATTTGGQNGIQKGSGASTLQGGGIGNPLNYINLDDIESIEVLKDADATSIYGSRAANGAILITTKKGKAGPTKIDISLQQGWGQVSKSLDMMNTQQYVQMRKEALRNDNSAIGSNDYDINGLWDTTHFTDWRKVLIGRTAQYTNINTSVSGGSSNTQFFVGGTYHRESTVFPGSFADQKGSLHFNFNSASDNKKFRFQFISSYLADYNQLPGVDLTNLAYNYAPDAPALYNSDGTLNWAPNAAGKGSWGNPLSYTLNRYKSETHNLLTNAILSYSILPGLEISSHFSYTNLETNEFSPTTLVSIDPFSRPTSTRRALYTYSTMKSWLIEPQVNYKRTIAKGKLDAILGTTIQQNNNNGKYINGSGYNSDAVLEDIHSAASVTVANSIVSVYKYNALFGRINYNWENKYLVSLNVRRDGSSRFGPQNQVHNFWSTGAAWIFSQEKFIMENFSVLSFGKLRVSYGTTGNDQIGDYTYINKYVPVTTAVAFQGSTGLSVNGLPNPNLQWEETKKLSVGMDLGFLKDRILINGTYSKNRSTNELLTYALPIITGNNSILENFPAVLQNIDWEFSLNSKNIQNKKFTWSSNLNLTIPSNKVVDFPNIALSTYASGTNGIIIGQPIGILKAYHSLGVDPATGAYVVADNHGNPTQSPNGLTDNTVLINTSPKFYGGFQNSFTYKGFQLDFLFQFVKQLGYSNLEFGTLIPGAAATNQPLSLIQRWEKPGDITPIQRYNTTYSIYSQWANSSISDAAYVDASFIRLKNLSLSYFLPEKWSQKLRLLNCNFFITGQNLLTVTKFDGLDPESQGISLPPLRILTIGIRVGLK